MVAEFNRRCKMAEDNNEDLSMEDILSSIKNILAEGDAASSQPEPTSNTSSNEVPVADVAEPVITPDESATETTAGEDDDIFDLSPDMRVEDIIPSTSDINLDEELDGVSTTVADLSFAEPSLGMTDDNSDPFDTLEDDRTGQLSALAEEETPAENILPAVEPENIVVAEEQPAPAMVAAPVPEVQEPAVEIQKPAVEVQEQVAEVQKEEANAIDASASIISNFAKMFAKEEKQAPQTAAVELPREPVKDMGNISRTLEDMIHDVIRNIIGDEVAANWKNGLNYDLLAKEEISRQTRLWLEANLPAIVEKTVKEEIERVMAKVGTNQ